LDISETGLYTFEISGDINDGWLFYIDGLDVKLDATGTVAKYLRKGIHPLYLRTYKDSSSANAFRMRLMRESQPVEDAQAFVAEHGRYAVVYHDWKHAQRLGYGDSPSFYQGPTTALDHANVMMGSSPLLGMVVGVGARQLADYMMRDILSVREVDNRNTIPSPSIAGKVMLSSDMVPDTIYSGEQDDSILELYLETFGYLVVDGAKPFSLVSHIDGSITEVYDGSERVLDLPSDAFYVVDDHYDHYNIRDAIDDEFKLRENAGDAWADEHTYQIDDIDVDITDPKGIGHKARFSTNGFVIYQQALIGTDWLPIYESSSSNGFIIPPGLLTVSFIIETDDEYLKFEVLGGKINGQKVYSDEIDSELEIIQYRKKELYLTPIPGQVELSQNCPIIEDGFSASIIGEEGFNKLLKISFALNTDIERYNTANHFLNELEIEFRIVSEEGQVDLLSMELHNDYEVYCQAEKEFYKPMILAVPSSGLLSDIKLIPLIPPELWHEPPESVELEILGTDDSSLENITLDTSDNSYPTQFESGDITSLGRTLLDTPFDAVDSQGHEIAQHHAQVRAMGEYGFFMNYFWNYRDNDGLYTTNYDANNWAFDVSLGMKRSAGTTYPTDIGQMIPADLDDFKPLIGIDTSKLKELDRKFIHYSGYGGEITSLANPITLQASPNGGGILSYGISTPISYEHVMGNSSISNIFMQMIAHYNMMNLWGLAPKKDSIVDVKIGLERWDELDIYVQEGWAEETLWDGSGTLESWIAASVRDSDGADWYHQYDEYTDNDEYYFDETFKVRQAAPEMSKFGGFDESAYYSRYFDLGNYLMRRYPQIAGKYVEFSINQDDFDAEDFEDGPLYLEARLILGGKTIWKNVTIDALTDTIRFELRELSSLEECEMGNTKLGDTDDDRYTSYYHSGTWFENFYQVGSSSKMEKETLRTIDSSSFKLFDSRTDDGIITPILITAIYKENPNTLRRGDVAQAISNLVYYDYSFLKMTLDRTYADEYRSNWDQEKINRANLKPVFITLGAAFLAVGFVTTFGGSLITGGTSSLAGVPMMVFGFDMIYSNIFDVSIIERGLSGLLYASLKVRGMNATFMEGENAENFSFYHFTSNHIINLVLTQITFVILGGIFSLGSSFRGLITSTLEQKAGPLIAEVYTDIGQPLGLGISSLRAWGGLTIFATTWLMDKALHIAFGTLMMAIGTIRSSWGDGGLTAEILITGIMVASIICRVYQMKKTAELKQSGDYNTLREIGKSQAGSSSQINFIGRIQELRSLWSINSPAARALFYALALDLAADALEIASMTVGAGM
jgi:hypothetical protein